MSKLHTFLAKRLYSKPKTDAVSLADALGLLSPSRNPKASLIYKPSLFRNLQKGSVTEQYKELEQGLDYSVPSVNHRELFDALVVDLQAVNVQKPKRRSEKSLSGHIKSLEDEDELFELLRLSYYQKNLSLLLLTKFLLNRNLRDLSRLPFDVKNLDESAFKENGWTAANFAEFRILLLKKYHDLKSPLSIVRLLKKNFDLEFFPLLQAQALLPFYERIVWKFYYDFLETSQDYMVQKLDSMRHSFLIWEASAHDSELMRLTIAKQHKFNNLQQLLVDLASWEHSLGESYRKFLSCLKAISAKFKLYDVKSADDVVTRALTYSLIHKLEQCVQSHFPNWKDDDFLDSYMEKLRLTRLEMVQREFPSVEGSLASSSFRFD